MKKKAKEKKWDFNDFAAILFSVMLLLFLWKQIWLNEEVITIMLIGVIIMHFLHQAEHKDKVV